MQNIILLAVCKALANEGKLGAQARCALALRAIAAFACAFDQSLLSQFCYLVGESLPPHTLLLEKALLLHQRNTMNANAIKAAAKPLGMLAVRCSAPSQSTFCPRIEREAPRR